MTERIRYAPPKSPYLAGDELAAAQDAAEAAYAAAGIAPGDATTVVTLVHSIYLGQIREATMASYDQSLKAAGYGPVELAIRIGATG